MRLGYFTQVSGFSSQTDVLEYPEGGQNSFVHRLPSRIKQGNITLKRGVISDEKVLLDWYNKVVVLAQPVTLLVRLNDTEENAIKTWSFDNAWPVKWTGSDLSASGSEFATETLEVAHHGMTVQL